MSNRPPPRQVEPRPVSTRDVTPGALAGIDRELITRVVHSFYDEIRKDEILGPIFVGRIPADHWGPHLDNMVEFWSSVTLLTGTYKGKPVPAHMPMKLSDDLFRRWLALFETVVSRLCTPEGAALFMERAQRIADSLRMATTMMERGGPPPLVEPLGR